MTIFSSTILLLFLVVSVSLYAVFKTYGAKAEDHEHIILRKVTDAPIQSRFTPVFIYRLLGGDSGAFAGSGSVFVGSHGEQIVTAEHLFGKALGEQIFGWRKLRPLEGTVTHGVDLILNTGSELTNVQGAVPDIIIIKAGEPKPIQCFSELTLDLTSEQIQFAKSDTPLSVTSLVSGEKVRVLGTAMFKGGKGPQYAVLEYESISGESGSGFVDGNDGLYVLKGSLVQSTPENEKLVRELLGSTKRMSLAYGPLLPP